MTDPCVAAARGLMKLANRLSLAVSSFARGYPRSGCAAPRQTAATALSRRLVLAALLVPLLLFALVAWQDRRSVLRDAQKDVSRMAAIFAQHAQNVFETHALVASRVEEWLHGRSWAEISGSESLHRRLDALARHYPQIGSLWLIDGAGKTRNSSLVFPIAPVDISDRDLFTALRDRDVGTFIGRPVIGRVSGIANFSLAQRRERSSGTFDGLVTVSVLPGYFTEFWKRSSGHPDAMTTLVRDDGVLLARNPPPTEVSASLPETSPLRLAMARADAGSYRAVLPIDGVERLFAFQKVEGFPVYLGYGVAVAVALGRWHRHLAVYGGFFALAALALTAIAILAARRAQRAAVALHRWRSLARRLRREIERRAAAEEQLRHSQKMAALGQLASGVVHDFGNLLSIIVGNLELLQLRAIDHRSNRYVEAALQGAARANGALQSLLAFARRQPLHAETFDLGAAIEEVAALAQPALSREIRLEIALASETWPVRADRNQTALALLNLVLNARDAMPEGGLLGIETSNLRLAGEIDDLVGDFVALAVTDSGVGIPPEVIPRVFEPFFTTKTAGAGSGLGLSAVYGFAKQSSGTVTIRSAVGTGTVVTLYLPRGIAAPDPALMHQAHAA
jgi:signal transduction histidine kinase